MKLLFKQRNFSWFDSYDVCNEHRHPIFTVRGRLDWGHKLEVYNMQEQRLITLKQEIFTFLPKFNVYTDDILVGQIAKEFSLQEPSFHLNMNGWSVEGNFVERDYKILNVGDTVATIEKQLLNWTDTYVVDVANEEDHLHALAVVLAIDAVKLELAN